MQPNADVFIGYGSTEAMVGGCVEVAAHRPVPDRLDQFTVPDGIVVDIVDPSGESVAIGEVGELLIHNRFLADRYFQLEDLTAATFFVRNGVRWCRSGDRAVRLANDKFELAGRIDGRLKVLGHNVEPSAIEAVLRSHKRRR